MPHVRLDAADTAELAEILDHLINHFDTLDNEPIDHTLVDITTVLDQIRHQLLNEKILP